MPKRSHILAALALLPLLAVQTWPAADTGTPPDYTRASPESLGIRPVPPRKDPKTGFVVGGRNPTRLLAGLTEIAGRPVPDLEKDMRPGALSGKGFLGPDERLLDVLAADNRYVVDGRGLARHLHVLGALAVRHASLKPLEVRYHGRRYRIRAACSRGFQDSPFRDGTRANCDATVENLGNGKRLTYSLLVPFMVERYGFYEGTGTPYRVEPRTALEVFDFLKPARGR